MTAPRPLRNPKPLHGSPLDVLAAALIGASFLYFAAHIVAWLVR